MARLGDILINNGYITQSQLEAALAAQGSERGMLGQILLRRGLISLDQLGDALSQQYGVPYMELLPQAINPQVARLLPEELARERSCVPVQVKKGELCLAMASRQTTSTRSAKPS